MTTNTKREQAASDDSGLVYSAKQGNMAAFEELVARHTPMIFRVAMHIAGSREDAEDIVQDAFFRAFQHLQQFEERARFSTWLTRLDVNEAFGKLRRSQRRPTIPIEDVAVDGMSLGDRIADWRPNPEQYYDASQLRDLLQKALVSLPDHYRVVFLLRDIEGLSIADTAGTLGLSVPCVKARLLNARLKLRENLSPHFDHNGIGVKFSVPRERALSESLVAPTAI